MGTYLYRTENVAVNQAPTTFTHGLGVAPTLENGHVFVTQRTSTGVVYINASSSQIVVLQATLDGVAIDLLVMAFHTIIK